MAVTSHNNLTAIITDYISNMEQNINTLICVVSVCFPLLNASLFELIAGDVANVVVMFKTVLVLKQ